MTKIVFWNVKRLGESTDAARAAVLTTLAKEWRDPNLNLYCELSTKCAIPPSQNLTYRKDNASQLCYGAVDAAGASVNLTAVKLIATQGYKNAGYAKGNQFDQLADRALGHVGTIGGAEVYVIHAPSGGEGKQVMAFVCSSLVESFSGGQQWLVVGDFNVVPDVLGAAPVGINVATYIRRSGVDTFLSHSSGKWAEYDYALGNFDVKVKAMRSQYWRDATDHSPILLEY